MSPERVLSRPGQPEEQEHDRAGVLNTAPVLFNVVGHDRIQNNNPPFISSSVFSWNHPEESNQEY